MLQLYGYNNLRKIGFLSILILLNLIPGCVSTGTSKLSEHEINKVIEGESRKSDIIKLFGHPEQSLKLDKMSLDNYISRILSMEVPDNMFPEGQYEVWTYNKWSNFAVDPLVIPSHEISKVCLLIFNSNDICIKKFYDEEDMITF